MLRKAIFSGGWYPGTPQKLEATIKGFNISYFSEKLEAVGAIVPHAGYIYSGETAQTVFGNINLKSDIIILSPNHRGIGSNASIMAKGEWETPLGNLEINTALATELLEKSSVLNEDFSSHLQEHSIEIELPLIRYNCIKIPKIVPVTFKKLSYPDCVSIAQAISDLMKANENIQLFASTDFSHGETMENTKRKDKLAIDQILKIDSIGLYNTVFENNITMCGVIPVTILLKCMEILGLNKANLLKQTNSAEISGNYDYIVGYAGIIIN